MPLEIERSKLSVFAWPIQSGFTLSFSSVHTAIFIQHAVFCD